MTSFTMNPGFRALFHRSEQGRAVLEAAAEKVAEAAREVAPVKTGQYRDSIDVQVDGDAGEGVFVVADDYKAGWIEFGTAGTSGHAATPAHSPLRKGAQAAGLDLRGRKK